MTQPAEQKVPTADESATRWGGLGEERRSLPPSKIIGVDVGSTTVKAVVMEDGKVGWQDYQRHNTRQAEKVLEFLARMETEAGFQAGRDRVFFTGSGAGFIAPLVGGKLIQEVVAVAACVERQHPVVVRRTHREVALRHEAGPGCVDDHAGPRLLGDRAGAVARAGVDEDDLVAERHAEQRRLEGLLLVEGDQDGGQRDHRSTSIRGRNERPGAKSGRMAPWNRSRSITIRC